MRVKREETWALHTPADAYVAQVLDDAAVSGKRLHYKFRIATGAVNQGHAENSVTPLASATEFVERGAVAELPQMLQRYFPNLAEFRMCACSMHRNALDGDRHLYPV